MYQNNDQPASVDGLAAALPCKTPVSLLQELCMRRGISPKYDLLQIEGAVHEPTFVYRVTVGEFTANGSGQSKKKAKHAAAKAVLDIIIHGGGPVSAGPPAAAAAAASQHSGPNGGDTSTGPVANNDSQHADLSTMVVSPYDDGIPGNPVGQLQELCMTRRWPPPTYQLTAEEGFPHERTFSIACTIATYKEVGGGKSKKLAKRQAAYSMLQKLRELPQEQQPSAGLNEDDDDVLARSGDGCGSSRSPADNGRGDRLLEEDDGREDTLLHGDSGDASRTMGRRAAKNKNKSLFIDDELQNSGTGTHYDDGPLFADQTSSSLDIEPERDDLFQDHRSQVTSDDSLFEDDQRQVSGTDGLFQDDRSIISGGGGRESKRYEGSLFPGYDCQDGGVQIDGGVGSYGTGPKLRSKTRREQKKNLDRNGGDGISPSSQDQNFDYNDYHDGTPQENSYV